MRKSLMWKSDWNSWCHDARMRTDILWCLTQFGKLIGLTAHTSTQGCRCLVCYMSMDWCRQMILPASTHHGKIESPSEQVLCMEIGVCDEEKLDVEEWLKQLVPWCKNENWHPLMLNSIWKADRADGTNKYTRVRMFCSQHVHGLMSTNPGLRPLRSGLCWHRHTAQVHDCHPAPCRCDFHRFRRHVFNGKESTHVLTNRFQRFQRFVICSEAEIPAAVWVGAPWGETYDGFQVWILPRTKTHINFEVCFLFV